MTYLRLDAHACLSLLACRCYLKRHDGGVCAGLCCAVLGVCYEEMSGTVVMHLSYCVRSALEKSALHMPPVLRCATTQ